MVRRARPLSILPPSPPKLQPWPEVSATVAFGGIVTDSIDNGMGLLGFSAASKFMVTAVVLLAAVTIDALARRGRTPGT